MEQKDYLIKNRFNELVEIIQIKAKSLNVISRFIDYKFEEIMGTSQNKDFLIELRQKGDRLSSFKDVTDTFLCTTIHIYDYDGTIIMHEAYMNGYRNSNKFYIGRKQIE